MNSHSKIGEARFRGAVVIVGIIAVLYVAKSVFIPIALGVLLSFVLGPLVVFAQRFRIGRIASVISVLTLCTLGLTFIMGVLGAQLMEFSNNIRRYESNIVSRISDFRSWMPTGIEKARSAIEKIEEQVLKADVAADESRDGLVVADTAMAEVIRQSNLNRNGDPKDLVVSKTPGNRIEPNAADPKVGVDAKPVDAKPVDAKPVDAKPVDAKPVDAKPVDAKPVETKPVETKPIEAEPVKVAIVSEANNPVAIFLGLINPVLEPMATAGIVIVLAIFILLDEGDFRSRLISLFDTIHDDSIETAINEAADRSMTWLRTMFLINALYGVAVTIGLYAFGLPTAPLWGFIGFICRFVPYIGPWIGATIPILMSLGVFVGWGGPFAIIAMYVVYELIVNLVLEPLMYGRSLGLTSVGIILSAIFWTWLWGPAGLVIAVPVTMWLVVLGKYLPHISPFTVLFGDSTDRSERVFVEPKRLNHQPSETTP